MQLKYTIENSANLVATSNHIKVILSDIKQPCLRDFWHRNLLKGAKEQVCLMLYYFLLKYKFERMLGSNKLLFCSIDTPALLYVA